MSRPEIQYLPANGDIELLIGRVLMERTRELGTVKHAEDFDGHRFVYTDSAETNVPFSYRHGSVIPVLAEKPAEELADNQRRVGAVVVTRHGQNQWSLCFLNGPSWSFARVDELVALATTQLDTDPEDLLAKIEELISHGKQAEIDARTARQAAESPVEALLRAFEERGTMLCKAERQRLTVAFEEGVKLGHKEGYATGLREGTNGVVLG